MTRHDTVHIALATDTAYLPWAAVSVLSCQRATSPCRVHVHVLHEGDLTSDAQRAFASMVSHECGEVSFHMVEGSRLDAVPSKGPELGGKTSWIRITLADLLPDLDRIVYLDADTLTVQSVEPLWTEPLGDAGVAAVANVVEPARRGHVADLGIEPTQYFNAGVLVMNLQLMRDENTYERVLDCVGERGKELSWYDQDALNLVFAGRWHALHPRWNTQNSLWYWRAWACEVFGERAVHEALSDPAVVHFEGPSIVKPWHYLCQHPFRRHYRDVLQMTPWRDAPLLERTAATRVIRRLPQGAQLPAYGRLQAFRTRHPKWSLS
ncbi:MAG: glycosyltransferase family 8 protein [Actinobacteria bacterium]|nr:glycosyltransferase family 8 protein [Actinomycetota bacterium]